MTMQVPDWALAAVAGALGGMVRLFSRPEESWIRRVGTATVGAVTAIYGTPVASPIVASYLAAYEVPIAGVSGLCGFLLGMIGLSVCEGTIRIAQRWRAKPTWPPEWKP